MSRNLSIIIIFIALLPIAIYFIYQSSEIQPSQFNILQEDRETMLAYSYKVLYDYFDQKNNSHEDVPILKESDVNYNILFITLLHNGTVRGCQSGSTDRTQENRLFFDIEEAIVESIEDERFGGRITSDEVENCDIMFTFLYNISWLYNTSLSFLQNNIELGIHAIEILYNNTPIIFKDSVPIENNYNLEYTLERLCLKGGLNIDCYSREDVELYRYDTLTFMGEKNSPAIELYRYNILVNLEDIDNDMIYSRISSANHWYIQSINNQTNRLEYEYYPSDNEYSNENNHVRQLASLWALTELRTFFNNDTSKSLIFDTLDYYLGFLRSVENYSYIMIDDEAKLGNNAFLILSLINTPDYENQAFLLDQLANGILSLQNENGSFNTFFFSDKNTGLDYYPGEAMLSLMKLYEYVKNKAFVDSVNKGFYYYREYWRNNKNTAFIPWHSQTYTLLFDEIKRQDISDFIFEMNDWMIDNYQIQSSKYVDELGGFPKYYPTFSTSVFLEGMNDAYTVAVTINDSMHGKKYQDAIINGTRFVLQTQFTEMNSFYVEDPSRTIGGFKTSLTDNTLRIDNTQHAVMALMKTYENHIFQPSFSG